MISNADSSPVTSHATPGFLAGTVVGLLQATEKDSRGGGEQRLRVLLVDDNADAVKLFQKLLGVLGYEVRAATSGKAALEEGASFQPHVVLLDLGMSEMDGFETADEMRKRPWGAATTIIALTGWGQPADRERTMRAGFFGHLVKPLKLNELLALLKKP